MFIRFAIVVVSIIASVTIASAQDQHKKDRHERDQADKASVSGPIEQKWVEDSIEKFFTLPDDVFNVPETPPARR